LLRITVLKVTETLPKTDIYPVCTV